MFKKLGSYLSINRRAEPSTMFSRSRSCHVSSTTKSNRKSQVTPTGCLSVYVGPEKQRFVIKAVFLNHPLFKMLLDDAELEYGFTSEGPLHLPCEVDLFRNILAEIDSACLDDDNPKLGFAYGSCSPFNPARRLGKSSMAKGCGSYGLLTPPRRQLQINPF